MHRQQLVSLLVKMKNAIAIHIAIAPVVANKYLAPGRRIGFVNDDSETVSDEVEKYIGIVDPFLENLVLPGQRFFMFLLPNTITSLKHNWSHPDFGNESKTKKKKASEAWMEDYCRQYGVTPEDMIEAAGNFLEGGDYFNRGGTFEGESVPDEFWDHYEVIVGTKVSHGDRESFFTCSC